MRAAVPPPSRAYDIEILPRGVGSVGADHDHGWVFGLPRGIKTEEWPLDPTSGSPLQHGFTLWLPHDYRCRGADIAGFAFFGTAFDHCDGSSEPLRPWSDLIKAPGDTIPDNPAWRRHWHQARSSAARTWYFIDKIGYAYAVILLSETEMNGGWTNPPDLPPILGPAPKWQRIGSYEDFCSYTANLVDLPPLNPEQSFSSPLTANRGLRLSPRDFDPNVGKFFAGDYWVDNDHLVDPFNDAGRLKDWASKFASNHLGGTMLSCQDMPDMGPFYVEFDERFGGFNFGTGNAQFDIERMTFDWACD